MTPPAQLVRLLDSGGGILFEKNITCLHDVNSGWCLLRHTFAAPTNGQVKIVLENDESADPDVQRGIVVDNVLISRNLNFVINGTFNSGPEGVNQPNVPGWGRTGNVDIHGSGGFGGSNFGRALDLNGSFNATNGAIIQTLVGLTPGQILHPAL